MFCPDVWQGKLKAIESLGYAVTRRLSGLKELNKEPDKWNYTYKHYASGEYEFTNGSRYLLLKPRFRVGQVVYRKEAWNAMLIFDHLRPSELDENTPIGFADTDWDLFTGCADDKGKLRSPMFLRECHARYFPRILELRPERLQEITEEDAIAEGCRAGIVYPNKWPNDKGSARDDFAALWDIINPQHPWAGNWWVTRYKFELWSKPE